MVNKNIIIAIATVVIIVVAAASFAVLSNSDQKENRNTEKTEVVIIDDLGRNVTVQLPIERVVIPSYESFRAYTAVTGDDFMDLLVGGLGDFENIEKGFYDAYVDTYPKMKTLPSVGNVFGGSFSAESVINLTPDVVIFPSSVIVYNGLKDTELQSLTDAGVPCIFVDFFIDPYKEGNFSKNVNILGKLMGKEDRAADIIKFFDAEVNKIYSKLPSGNGPTIYTELMSGPESYGNTSTYGYPEIDRIKGVNIAKFSPLGDAAGQISAEFLIAQNPDMIYLAASTFYGDKGGKMFGYGASPTDKDLADMAQEYMDRAGWNTLDAVKNKDVYFIYNMFRSNVECFTLLQQAAAWMYPEIFGDLDPEKSLSLFYEKFMPFELKGNWFYKVI